MAVSPGVCVDHVPVHPMSFEFPPITIVVIGRNEGERLVRCLESVQRVDYPEDRIELIYVDTDSTDGSCAVAERLGAKVIAIRPERPCAAAARNAGLAAASHELIQFLDGDTILDPAWLKAGVAALEDPSIVCVFGRVEEVDPTASIYNFWAHHDWYVPPGLADYCGGIALFRAEVVHKANGYDESLIAGEEPDLCYRIRQGQGLHVLCVDKPMVLHDINMTGFGQYWRRCKRTGRGYAEVAHRCPGLQRWRRMRWRNPCHIVVAGVAVGLSIGLSSFWPVGLWLSLITLAIARNALRFRRRVGSLAGAALYSLHHYVAKLPITVGQCDFWLRTVLSSRCRRLSKQ